MALALNQAPSDTVSGTVTVACKLPNGIRMQMQRMRTVQQPIMGGGFRDVQEAEWFGKVVVINGCSQPVDRPSKVAVQGGFALTYGVDAKFFHDWMEQNADHPSVVGGYIYAHETMRDVESYVGKHEGLISGLEPTNPKRMPVEFQSIATAET